VLPLKKHLLILLLILGFASRLLTQTAAVQLKDRLADVGFENIRVEAEGDEYTISFENNIYGWNVRAVATALDTLSKYAPGKAKLNVIQLRFDIPQIVTKVNAADRNTFRKDTLTGKAADSLISISYKTKKDWDKIRKTKPLQRNTVKFDFVFYPQFTCLNFVSTRSTKSSSISPRPWRFPSGKACCLPRR